MIYSLYILIDVIPNQLGVQRRTHPVELVQRCPTGIHPQNLPWIAKKYFIFNQFVKELPFPNHPFPVYKCKTTCQRHIGTAARRATGDDRQATSDKGPDINPASLKNAPHIIRLPSSELLCHKKLIEHTQTSIFT